MKRHRTRRKKKKKTNKKSKLPTYNKRLFTLQRLTTKWHFVRRARSCSSDLQLVTAALGIGANIRRQRVEQLHLLLQLLAVAFASLAEFLLDLLHPLVLFLSQPFRL